MTKVGRYARFAAVACAALVLAGQFSPSTKAQSSLGGTLAGVTSAEQRLFDRGKVRFAKTWSPTEGLGPVSTQLGCNRCHGEPVVGGLSSLRIVFFGKSNEDGSFNPMTEQGGTLLQPESVERFLANCTLTGERLPAEATRVSRRMSPPLFGAGLIDSISDEEILAHAVDKGDGIHGMANLSLDHAGTLRVGRFGAKAQFSSLIRISGEALAADLGITNPLVPDEFLPQGNPIPAGCDASRTQPNNDDGRNIMSFFHFTAFLAPNQPAALTTTGQSGKDLFDSIGCAKCHVASLQTAAEVMVPVDLEGSRIIGPSLALSNQTVNLYSDLLLHDMGPGLDDGVPMGQASGNMWRTTPLWALSQKTFFLHNGGTTDLTTAILSHGGEATTVIDRFSNELSEEDRANVLEFLRSL